MGKVIKKNVITRKKGFLYYVDGKGNVCEAKMARGGKRKKKKAVKKKAVRRKAPVKKKATKRKPARKKRR
tara:strand:+ start:241 stop:450 length:210 start_codon:yes stop_codon:yes gene_type:complete